MNQFLIFFLVSAIVASGTARAENLAEDIKSTQVRGEADGEIREKTYSYQERQVPLSGKWDIDIGAGESMGGGGFLVSDQLSLEIGDFFSDRWRFSAGFSYLSNRFNNNAQNLQNITGYLPDVDYAKYQGELRLDYNLFYGKFRFSRDQAFNFDNYVGLGAVESWLSSGTSTGLVADFGLAFWLKSGANFKLGIKDYYYGERRLLSKGESQHVFGVVQAGFLF